ncbi:Serine/threonine protein kinase [Handroanthus impetiginosus]|uniref:Serine/threonine protein kinase n=1 Tax=Handroanthus impetiginosus TaxID=429701 RepID=A0A2G9I8Q0_9LAMI|nr:Serine/threonine protein kinase [Handroanthus impetiginosus]
MFVAILNQISPSTDDSNPVEISPSIEIFYPKISPTSYDFPSPPSGNGLPKGVAYIIGLITVAVIFVVAVYCAQRMKRAVVSELKAEVAQPMTSNAIQVWEVDAPKMEKFFIELAQENPVRFTAQQLFTFTENYNTMLGRGGFGSVYKGQFPNGVKIAVKVLNRGPDKSIEEQFMAEVGTIGRTYHINLVRLYGFCYDQFMSALVYEFMENGSLDKHLFSENQNLEWDKLHQIAVGTAKGIAYLHEECKQRIIHYDIKPGNVLLDENFAPKVADFGLAKLCNREDTHVTVTGYRGTPGYLAPEFMLKNFPITYKCDVYSFGILLFEIVGRRKNTNVSGSSDSLDWFPKQVWEEYEKGKLMELTVACGIEEKDRVNAERMAMVALWCAQDSPEMRPPMSAVVKMLEGGVEIMPPPKPFHYLFSVGTDVLKAPKTSGSGSGYTTSEGTNSYWYKETTPIMAKYEITMASI